jgi:ABC-type multidrug transport system ATPase subunit
LNGYFNRTPRQRVQQRLLRGRGTVHDDRGALGQPGAPALGRAEVIGQTGLGPEAGKKIGQLSKGYRQRVGLAAALLHEPEVLILDEPTRGVDVATKVEIYHLIGKLADGGAAIILISSELPEILGMSNRMLVMQAGRMVGEFTKEQAGEENLLACATGVDVKP